MKNRTLKYAAAFASVILGMTSMAFDASADDAMKIVALGDSITNGYSMDGSLIASYPQLVSSYYGAELVNFAEDSMTSAELLSKISDPAVQSEIADADIVLITIGGNDIMKPVLNNEFIDASKYNTMTELIAAIKAESDKDLFYSIALQTKLNSFMPDAIKNCNANIQQLSEQLSSMTSARIVFQTLYNPMDLKNDNTALASSGSMTVLCANVNSYLEGKPDNTLYPIDGGVNDIIRGLTGSLIVDTFETFADHSYFYTHIKNVDVHPNSKGHLAIAESIIETLDIPETGSECGTLIRRAYTLSGAENTLAGVAPAINDGILGRVLKNSYGDVDADGAVNINDATAALTIYASNAVGKAPEITGVNALAADSNKDGSVNIEDATLILEYYSGKAAGIISGTFDDFVAGK